MMTLQEAVDELNSMTSEEAEKLFATYSNKHLTPRYRTCPVAKHLSARCEKPIDVFSFGLVEVHETIGKGIYLPRHIIPIITKLDGVAL